ncbi:hypothetical protein [Kitasatospora sp. McL0602]|uniref:hypothetical protein n=1 Tax=Kitasatospora sp. McL0602 TaxID=3439530 RepID=UPI003F8CC2D3
MEFPQSIPHFSDDREVETFFRTMLGLEYIDDVHLHREWARGKKPSARHVREALEYLLRERPATSTQWARLTEVSFWEDDRLYGYLQGLYDYFYGDREDPPVPPDPEEIPPEKYWQ